jgi:hypothetical protein
MKWKRLTTGDGATPEASWQWDNEGRMARVQYPLNEAAYTCSYDTMGRLSGTVVSWARYNMPGGLTSTAASRLLKKLQAGLGRLRQEAGDQPV